MERAMWGPMPVRISPFRRNAFAKLGQKGVKNRASNNYTKTWGVKCLRKRSPICLAFSDGESASLETTQARNPFQNYSQQPDGLQSFLSNTPKAILLTAGIASIGASGLLGYLAGSQAPVAQRLLTRVLGTVLGSGVALLGLKKLKEKRDSAALLELYNALSRHQNIGDLSAEELKAIDSKFGISLATSRIPEMKAIYDTYIESVIPTTSALKGDEPEKLKAFKNALGLSPHDAASAHLDVGRRFLRLANEADKRSGKTSEYRNALSKLIYVSSLVFEERQEAFLLPWQRAVNYGPADVMVSKRNQATSLFKDFLSNQPNGLPADKAFWQSVKEFQERVKLDEKISEEIIRESTRAEVETHLEKAIECQKRRGRVRDLSELVKEVQYVLEYSLDLEDLAKNPDMPKGLGKVTIYGGKLESSNQTRELRDVYRNYFEEQLRVSKEVSDDLEDDMEDLQTILGLGKKEAADIVSESTSRAYRALLREEVSSGRLDSATSKAEVLGNLCTKLNFDPDAAAALHRQLYRQKLDQLLEKKKLTDQDAAELDRQRRLLCIKKADVQQSHRDTCGRIYTSVVEDALNAGPERFTNRDRNAVLNAMRDVRLDPALAKEILTETVKRGFMGFVTRSRNKPNRLEAAKELKSMVFFSNLVVTPLLEDINDVMKSGQEAAFKELADTMAKAKEMAEKEEEEEAKLAASTSSTDESAEKDEGKTVEASSESETKSPGKSEQSEASTSTSENDDSVPESLKKSQEGLKKEADEASTSGQGPIGQKEITLSDDLELRDRTEIYRNFLLYCMQGNVVQLSMGTSVQVQRDQAEFARLAQLGDILGLNQLDIHAVHTGLAEQAFSSQVQGVMAGGGLTKEKVEELNEMRSKFGLSEASAQKIIKGAQNRQIIDNMNASKATGDLSLQRLLEMQEQGIDISGVTSDELRASLYTKEMANVLTNGTGEFDRTYFVDELPKKLGIKERRVKQALESLAKERKRTTLVQAVSYLRQKKLDDAVKSLNNLLACHKALPSDAKESWQPREELMDLFSVYLGRTPDQGKQSELANVIDISEKESGSLRQLVEAGNFKLPDDAEEEKDIF